MPLSIHHVLRQFKADVAKAVSPQTILKICGYLHYTWRDRVLDPVTTVHVFLLQILHGNTACTALPRLAGLCFTAGAYCSARMRLPLALFQDLLERVCDALYPEIQNAGRWRGHRTKVITLVTTLVDPLAYPKAALAELYLSRWRIEVNLGHLKTTMGMAVLHCKTKDGVLKALYMFALAYNLIRLVMLEASRLQKVPLDRISFIDALRWLRDAQGETKLTPLVVNPLRPNRLEQRVIKRRIKEYPLMKKPRSVLRKSLPRKRGAS